MIYRTDKLSAHLLEGIKTDRTSDSVAWGTAIRNVILNTQNITYIIETYAKHNICRTQITHQQKLHQCVIEYILGMIVCIFICLYL